ncbi:MAG: hypothetical protein FJY48_13200 [Betaproteobacteria bacterium]|nr:hypothetical protein [Betaproteobacteria bacterium]
MRSRVQHSLAAEDDREKRPRPFFVPCIWSALFRGAVDARTWGRRFQSLKSAICGRCGLKSDFSGTTKWSDRQIASHFNEIGYLTPRGHEWLPQSVHSILRKYRVRLERLGRSR